MSPSTNFYLHQQEPTEMGGPAAVPQEPVGAGRSAAAPVVPREKGGSITVPLDTREVSPLAQE
jgi:hypothetical protein